MEVQLTQTQPVEVVLELGTPSNVRTDTSEDQEVRRAALRQAGQKFFEQTLQARSAHVDSSSSSGGEPGRQGGTADPEFEAFGRLLHVSKKYVYMAMFVAGTSISPLLIKDSFAAMQTPAVLLFFHMLAMLLALWIGARYEFCQLKPITPQLLKGAAVPCTLWSLQMLCLFSTLHHNSVIFALTWSTVGREAIQVVAHALLTGKSLEKDTRLMLIVAGIAAGLEFFFDTDKVWLGFLMMTLWTLLVILEATWKHLKADPQARGLITDFRILGLIRELSDEEDAASSTDMAFLKHALPSVPILLLGFIALEGRELVNHEPSVPGISVMLLACTFYVMGTACDLMMEGRVQPDKRLLLRYVALAGSIAAYFMQEIRTISWAACLFAGVSCSAAVIVHLRKKQ